MKIILDKKITNDGLKELYNLHLSGLGEINNLNNKINTLNLVEQVYQHLVTKLKKL